MAEHQLIDLGGDITILVGGNEDSKVRIRASKAILCLASDSFRDLVEPRSDEDEVMRAGEDIEFDDDDPEAFTILLKILHMRNDFPTPRPAGELLALALIAEKYDCVQAIRLELRGIFPYDIAQYNMHDLYDLIAATYILDHAELFWQCTKELLEDFVASEASIFRLSTLSSLVPSLLWLMIENRRNRILQAILSYQAGLFRLPCMNTTRGTCPIGSMYYQRVADIAETIGLGYFTSQETITMMVSRIERMHGAYIETPASTFPCMIPYEQHTFIADEPFETFWNTMTNLSRGVCLDCFKAGRLGVMQRRAAELNIEREGCKEVSTSAELQIVACDLTFRLPADQHSACGIGRRLHDERNEMHIASHVGLSLQMGESNESMLSISQARACSPMQSNNTHGMSR